MCDLVSGLLAVTQVQGRGRGLKRDQVCYLPSPLGITIHPFNIYLLSTWCLPAS